MKKILGIVEYNGTNYQGWQTQPQGQTIQDEIERVLSRLLSSEITIYGSGRTDAGVHALNQTFHFVVEKEIDDLNLFKHSINCLLNKDIRVKDLRYVDDNFHARISAVGKTYIYQFAINEIDVFNLPFVSLQHEPFDIKKLEESLMFFKGKHCFKNYTSKEEDEMKYVRTIHDISITKGENGIYKISLSGDGFMRYMIRFIVGTCFAYAKGQISLEKIKDRLDGKVDEITSYKADAKGLFLKEVKY